MIKNSIFLKDYGRSEDEDYASPPKKQRKPKTPTPSISAPAQQVNVAQLFPLIYVYLIDLLPLSHIRHNSNEKDYCCSLHA